MALKAPILDLGRCTRCDSCIAVSPAVFRLNPQTGLIEVQDLQDYPAAEVEAAIVVCPEHCISWGER